MLKYYSSKDKNCIRRIKFLKLDTVLYVNITGVKLSQSPVQRPLL